MAWFDKDYELEDRRDAADELFSKILIYVKRAYQGDSFYEFLLTIKKQGYTIDKHNVKPIETDALGAGTVEINLELSSYSSKMTISKQLEFK